MFIDPPELSSDLEWMLQSGQASQSMLAEALVEEYFPRVIRVALALFEEPTLARRVAIGSFAAALANLYRYRSGSNIDAWFYQSVFGAFRQVYKRLNRELRNSQIGSIEEPNPETEIEAEIWGLLESLSNTERVALLLNEALDLPLSDIAYLLSQQEREIGSNLRSARQALLTRLYQASETGMDVKAWLYHWLRNRWPDPRFLPGDLDSLVEEIVVQVGSQDASRRRSIAFKEISLMVVVIVLVIGVIRGASVLIPTPVSTASPLPTLQAGQSGQDLAGLANTGMITGTSPDDGSVMYWAKEGETLTSIAAKLGEPVDLLVRLNRLLPDESLDEGQGILVMLGHLDQAALTTNLIPQGRSLPPLSVNSDSEAIRQRILSSGEAWQTLWANVEVYDYGPSSAVRPPLDHRFQVWISKPDKGLELVGPIMDQPDNVFLNIAGLSYAYFPDHEPHAISSSSSLIRLGELHDLIYPGQAQWIGDKGAFQIIGNGLEAGRGALIVDWHNDQRKRELRLWVDAQTGVILHLLKFGGPAGITILENAMVTDIMYDMNFPAAIFDPRNASKIGYSTNPPYPSKTVDAFLANTGSQPATTR